MSRWWCCLHTDGHSFLVSDHWVALRSSKCGVLRRVAVVRLSRTFVKSSCAAVHTFVFRFLFQIWISEVRSEENEKKTKLIQAKNKGGLTALGMPHMRAWVHVVRIPAETSIPATVNVRLQHQRDAQLAPAVWSRERHFTSITLRQPLHTEEAPSTIPPPPLPPGLQECWRLSLLAS